MNICSQRTHDIIKLSLSFLFRKVSQIKLNGVGHVSRKVWLKSNTRRQFVNQCKNIFICLNRCALQIRESPGTKKKTKKHLYFFLYSDTSFAENGASAWQGLSPLLACSVHHRDKSLKEKITNTKHSIQKFQIGLISKSNHKQ